MRFFLVFFGLLAILFTACNDSFKQIDQATIDDIESRLDEAIQSEDERFDQAIYEYYELLYDLTKIKYRVLLIGLDKIISARNWNKHKYDIIRIALEGNMDIAPKELLDYQDAMTDFDSLIMIQIYQIIYSNSGKFGLDDNEVKRYIEERKGEYNKVKSKSLIEVNNVSNVELKLKMIHLANSERLKSLENILMELSGGRPLNCFEGLYFPVVMSATNIFNEGEMGTIKVGVGQYSTSIDSSDAKMIIRSDTIQMSNDGTFSYLLASDSPGEYNLPMKIVIRNPLSGQWTEAVEGEYVYSIR